MNVKIYDINGYLVDLNNITSINLNHLYDNKEKIKYKIEDLKNGLFIEIKIKRR